MKGKKVFKKGISSCWMKMVAGANTGWPVELVQL
jgi:hypothetical protein